MEWLRIICALCLATALCLGGCGGATDDLDGGFDAGVDADGGGEEDGQAGDLDEDGGGDPGEDGGDDLDAGPDDGDSDEADADGGLDDGDAEPDGFDGGADVDDGSDGGFDGGEVDAGGDVDPGAVLIIEQIGLSGLMGESALVIGPDGTSVLIDTGNDSHDNQVLAAIERQLGQRRVDWLVLTHYHADHVGGIEDLLVANPPLEVTRGIVSRGLVDVGDTVAESDYQQACEILMNPPGDVGHVALCDGPALALCDGSEQGLPWPASDCDGLLLGDATDAGDDGDGHLTYLPLGEGARLVFFHANTHLATSSGVIAASDHGVSVGHGATAHENGRSLGAVITWGAFQHSFHGDLHSEVEEFYTAYGAEVVEFPGGPALVGGAGLDTTHLSHHGLTSSSSQAWADWLLPVDGQGRNAVVGCNAGYLIAPSSQAMARVAPGLGAGFIWATRLGMWSGSHAKLRAAEGSVIVQVEAGGDHYQVYAWTDAGASMVEQYTSLVP